jgi:hypothetical protein
LNATAHVFAAVLIVPCLAFLALLVRRGHLRAKYALLWLPTGTAMLVFAVAPGLIDKVAFAIGISYPPAMLFAAATALLLMVCMHFSWELSRLEERVRMLSEEIALRSVQSPDHPAGTGADPPPPDTNSLVLHS